MDLKEKNFNVGDYIGDEYDRCWKIESVTEKEYSVVYIPENIRKTISREEKPHRWSHDKDYAEDYHLLRAHDHSDITEYPIGSVWKCNKKIGAYVPGTYEVTIMDYALSPGVFWVCNTKEQAFTFVADAMHLQPVINKDISEDKDDLER